MWVVNHKKWFYGIAIALCTGSALALIFWGLPLSIDFRGGSLLEIKYPDVRPSQDVVAQAVKAAGFPEAIVQLTGEYGVIIRTAALTEEEHQRLSGALALSADGLASPVEQRFDSVGPVIGGELKRRAMSAIIVALVAILGYITWAFRKVSYRVASWKYGVIAIVALSHDILIPSGIFALLGKTQGVEVDALFVTALLTILGFSIHDTIVIFDRIRENLQRYPTRAFGDIVGGSLSETFTRSINTSLTTILVLMAIFFLGGASVHFFALALALGIFFGTYSSIFVAGPLLVTWEEWRRKR